MRGGKGGRQTNRPQERPGDPKPDAEKMHPSSSKLHTGERHDETGPVQLGTPWLGVLQPPRHMTGSAASPDICHPSCCYLDYLTMPQQPESVTKGRKEQKKTMAKNLPCVQSIQIPPPLVLPQKAKSQNRAPKHILRLPRCF